MIRGSNPIRGVLRLQGGNSAEIMRIIIKDQDTASKSELLDVL